MVAIKDMKMPRSCYSCREQAHCYWALSNGWIQDKRDDNCPLIEIEQSDDCVSRQAVLDLLTTTGLKKFDFILDAREKVNNLPPVTSTCKSGLHWIERFDNESRWLECPHCHMDSITAFNYCPSCGADMRGCK